MFSLIITLLLHLIYFIIIFVCRALRSPRQRQEAFLKALNNEGQQQMTRAWPTWPKLRAAQQEAPKESNVKDEADD
jgi:hypothetical protein